MSEEVEVPGHDGTMIPLSIVHKKGIPMDGSNCCVLEGYGAYGISSSPRFSIRYSVAKRGVVLAFAHPRGGSEKGKNGIRRVTRRRSQTRGRILSRARNIS